MASDGRSDFSQGGYGRCADRNIRLLHSQQQDHQPRLGQSQGKDQNRRHQKRRLMEDTLIETFGCFSFNKGIINLDSGRERKRDNVRIADTAVARSA